MQAEGGAGEASEPIPPHSAAMSTMDTGTRQTVTGRIRLRGYASTTAELDLTYRNPRTRMTSAVLVLLGCWALAPIVFFVPPHIPWALGAAGAGVYLAYRRWTGEYIVHSFAGNCPNCGQALTLKPDQQVKLPHTIPCFSCHHEPQLQLNGGEG
jgi:hypothetical protein